MADILSSLGITAKSPDPNAYKNQKEVNAQIAEATSSLKGTLGAVDLAIGGLSIVPGVSDATLNQLRELKEDGESTLASASTMTPEQLEKKRADLETRLKAAQKSQEEAAEKARIKEAEDAAATIKKRADEIVKDSSVSKSLRDAYKSLADEAAKSPAEVRKAIVAEKSKQEGFQAVPSTTPVRSPTELLAALEELDAQKEAAENREFDMWRFLSRTGSSIGKGLFYIGIVLGAIVGGIVLSNTYVTENFWLIKVYYFFYGAVFFPLTILYGLVKPPYWYGTIAPLFRRQPDAPVVGLSDRLFGYQFIDPAVAGQVRPPGRTEMRIMCGLSTALVGGGAVYYGFLKS